MKRFLLYITFLFAVFTAAAQPPNDFPNPKKAEKIRALYVAYISQQLQFTPEEAQRFWPLHDQYQAEMQNINNSSLSELDRQQRMLNLKRNYQPKIDAILGRERSNNFYRLNDQFRDKLLEVRQHRQEMKAERKAEGGIIRENPGGGVFRRGNGQGGRRENMIPPKSN